MRTTPGISALVLSAALAANGASAARDWLVIQAGKDEVLLMDRSSFKRNGDAAEAWVLRSFDRTVTRDDGKYPHRSRRMHLIMDCRTGKTAYAELVLLSESLGRGNVVWSEKPARGAISFVTPETYAEKMLLGMACAA